MTSSEQLLFDVLMLRYQQCYSALHSLYLTLGAIRAKASPNIEPTMTVSQELLENLAIIIREVDPNNAKATSRVLASMTSAPVVVSPVRDLNLAKEQVAKLIKQELTINKQVVPGDDHLANLAGHLAHCLDEFGRKP